MTTFILIAAIITLGVLIILIQPLLRRSHQTIDDRQSQNIGYAKQRLAELHQQRDSGKIDDQALADLRSEIEATLAQDIDLDDLAVTSNAEKNSSSSPVLIAILCTLLPVSVLLIYWIVGSPQSLNESTQQSVQSISETNPSNSEIQAMIVELRKSLDDQPNNAEGWGLLARTLMATGQYQESIEANTKVLELSGENADIYAALADASAIVAGGSLVGQPLEYVKSALNLNPEHPQSLWLAGLASAQQGDNVGAQDYWNALLPLLADVPEQQSELAAIIQQSMNEPTAPAKQLDTNQETQNQDMGLTVLVSLSDNLKTEVLPNDTVFVFAKAKQGPPAPLAVKRLVVKDLPTQIKLNDADAMLPQFALSKFSEVIVSARISKSGQPTAQLGDLQSAAIQTTNNDSKIISVVISDIVK